MPMKIPADAKVITDNRITLIRVVTTLYEKLVNGDGAAKDQVKETMLAKGATYAQSDDVVAQLSPGSDKGKIPAAKLYALIKSKDLTLEQFLECVSVSVTPLKKYLGAAAIDELTPTITDPAPTLKTEFKTGHEIDVDAVAATLAAALGKSLA